MSAMRSVTRALELRRRRSTVSRILPKLKEYRLTAKSTIPKLLATSGSRSYVTETKDKHPQLPDINSTDIGSIPDPHTHDPKKWQKFAWKYLGALVTFGVAYKTLHWWVDRVEREGKRKRDDLEISKLEKYETSATREARGNGEHSKSSELLASSPHHISDSSSNTSENKQGADSNTISADSKTGIDSDQSSDNSFQVFKPVQDDPGYISQEDAVKLLEVELEARLKKLREQKRRTRETDAEKEKIKQELKDVRAELATFASNSKNKHSSS